jgi:hypothetical protein
MDTAVRDNRPVFTELNIDQYSYDLFFDNRKLAIIRADYKPPHFSLFFGGNASCTANTSINSAPMVWVGAAESSCNMKTVLGFGECQYGTTDNLAI